MFFLTGHDLFIRLFAAGGLITMLVWFVWHLGRTPLHNDETSFRPRFSRNILPEVHFSLFKRGGVDRNTTDKEQAVIEKEFNDLDKK